MPSMVGVERRRGSCLEIRLSNNARKVVSHDLSAAGAAGPGFKTRQQSDWSRLPCAGSNRQGPVGRAAWHRAGRSSFDVAPIQRNAIWRSLKAGSLASAMCRQFGSVNAASGRAWDARWFSAIARTGGSSFSALRAAESNSLKSAPARLPDQKAPSATSSEGIVTIKILMSRASDQLWA